MATTTRRLIVRRMKSAVFLSLAAYFPNPPTGESCVACYRLSARLRVKVCVSLVYDHVARRGRKHPYELAVAGDFS